MTDPKLSPDAEALERENRELRGLLEECMDCMKGHIIGVNCHGGVLPAETIARIAAALEADRFM